MNKGIPYFNDVSCRDRLTLFHNKGYRNIYSVRVSYIRPNGKKAGGSPIGHKMLHMDYGTYGLALDRYNIETSTDYLPSKWSLREISIVAMTYKDTKLVHEDTLLKVAFGTKLLNKIDGKGRNISNKVGEWVKTKVGEWVQYNNEDGTSLFYKVEAGGEEGC